MEPMNPIIVQSDMSILLEVMNPDFEKARNALTIFAELEKSPEYIHTYKITPLSLWNASACGISGEEVVETLKKYSKHDLPENVVVQILDYSMRYGKVNLIKEGEFLFIKCTDPYIIAEIKASKEIMQFCIGGNDNTKILVKDIYRGRIKQSLINIGYPVKDLAGYDDSASFITNLRSETLNHEKFTLRDYQIKAVDAFYANGSVDGGSGIVVLPCGAGKTVVGIKTMEKIKAETLILTTSITALKQWKRELLDKTSLNVEDIGEYSGDIKEIKQITIATYQILTSRKDKNSEFTHFRLFNSRRWGLIIYDEVHVLPAPVLRVTAEIQSKRRLGLTATLIREDGLQKDVFSLIGPKKYDLPWKVLENTGFIAKAYCTEIRISMQDNLKMDYSVAKQTSKFRIASENPRKMVVLKELLEKHKKDHVLIIGQYIDQIKKISEELEAPVLMGSTKNIEREKLYKSFKEGDLKVLIVSKVANFAVDLPDANVLIEVSGMFGSRQEEAQRLGRILRPKKDDNIAWFYTIVTHDTKEQEFAAKRQMFLTEQGYKYSIVLFDED